jgi:hypothetical protein
MGYPTNRTTRFDTDDGTITFDRATASVRWEVGENNHAVRDARELPFGVVFFAELGKVRWTRNTGGVIVGNDEYSQASESASGRGNTVNSGLGPVGAADIDAWTRTESYLDATGRQVRSEDFPGRKAFARVARAYSSVSGVPGRQVRGAPKSTGGQFNSDKPLAAGSSWLSFYGVTSPVPNLSRVTVDGAAGVNNYLRVTVNPRGPQVLSWTKVPFTS